LNKTKKLNTTPMAGGKLETIRYLLLPSNGLLFLP
jgi:hypothetical protein